MASGTLTVGASVQGASNAEASNTDRAFFLTTDVRLSMSKNFGDLRIMQGD